MSEYPDPKDLLAEIVQLAMDRMNTGDDISSWEAWTLGQISGIASRCPDVLSRVDDLRQPFTP